MSGERPDRDIEVVLHRLYGSRLPAGLIELETPPTQEVASRRERFCAMATNVLVAIGESYQKGGMPPY